MDPIATRKGKEMGVLSQTECQSIVWVSVRVFVTLRKRREGTGWRGGAQRYEYEYEIGLMVEGSGVGACPVVF